MTSVHSPRNTRIALFHDRVSCTASSAIRLASMAYQTVVCNEIADFSALLEQGHHFDVLLVPAQDNLVSELLSMGPELLDIPVLFLMEQRRWEGLPRWSKSFSWCDAMPVDAHESTDEELSWRLQALLSRKSSAEARSAQPFKAVGAVWGDYRFLERHHVVLHREREVSLQPRQYDFALQLFQNLGRVLTREWLRGVVWNAAHQRDDSRVFDVCAANLRRRLDLRDENGFVLKAVYKVGYCLFEAERTLALKK